MEFTQILAVFLSTFSYVTTSEINDFWTYQWDEARRAYDVGYYSKALNETERNYNIWDQEFMAVIFGLRNWRHLLSGSPHKVVVWTDHANLQYYWHPQKINRRVARYISTMAEYNLELKHLPEIKNRADALS